MAQHFDETHEVFWSNILHCHFIDLRWQMKALSLQYHLISKWMQLDRWSMAIFNVNNVLPFWRSPFTVLRPLDLCSGSSAWQFCNRIGESVWDWQLTSHLRCKPSIYISVKLNKWLLLMFCSSTCKWRPFKTEM